MAIVLSCQGITKHVASKVLFEDITLGIEDGDHFGIIGANGSGKTTFLKILAGLETPDEGDLTRRKFLKVAYVAQQDVFPKGATVFSAMQDYLRANGHPESELDVSAARTLSQLEFSDFDQIVDQLSGGWRKRLAIGCGLALQPDLLLLDEPTNHLDLSSVMWLEGLVKRLSCAWVVVSHDRMFLERTVTKLAEINQIYSQNMLIAEGRYSDFLTKREEFLASQSAYAASLRNKVRREVEWLQRGPKARTTKSKSRIEQAENLQAELADVNSSLRTNDAQVEFSGTGRRTKKLIELKSVGQNMAGRTLFSDFSLLISPKTRLAIVGPNGSGKSTLMKTITKDLPAATGSVTHAENLVTHYFEQDRASLDDSMTLRRALGQGSDHVIYRDKPVHIVSWAKRFKFDQPQLDTLVGDLSGGEKARVRIAQLMLHRADVLLLDEPTNDLDIPTLETLEDSLIDFPGAVILISHDRYLLERVCRQFVGLDGAGGSGVFASLEQCLKLLPTKKSANRSSGKATSEGKEKPKRKKLSYKDQRELEMMEETILGAEEELETAQQEANDPAIATNSIKLQEVQAKLEKAQSRVDSLYRRWAELEEMTAGENPG